MSNENANGDEPMDLEQPNEGQQQPPPAARRPIQERPRIIRLVAEPLAEEPLDLANVDILANIPEAEDDGSAHSGSDFSDEDEINPNYYMFGRYEDDNYGTMTEEQKTNYDITLPLEHRYLGGHLLQPVPTIHYNCDYEEGSVVENFPVLFLMNGMLFPGQIMPMNLTSEAMVDELQSLLDNHEQDRIFGLGTQRMFGITALIRHAAFFEDAEGKKKAFLKVEGRQRFRIQRRIRLGTAPLFRSSVVILPDQEPDDLARRLQSPAGGPTRLSRAHALSSAGLPPNFLHQFDARSLITRIKQSMAMWNRVAERPVEVVGEDDDDGFEGEKEIKTECPFKYPETVNAFSYFVLWNVPFPRKMLNKLLEMDNVIERLQIECAVLENRLEFLCSHCSSVVARHDDLLVMSKSGTSCSFVNPSGHFFELFCFRLLYNRLAVSGFSPEFSWFPEYEWAMISCTTCHLHLGWEFQTRNEELIPRRFFGVTRQALTIKPAQAPGERSILNDYMDEHGTFGLDTSQGLFFGN